MNRFDVIIIGTGAGGGTLAWALAGTGKKILLIERGDYLRREKENWDPKAVFEDQRYVTRERWYDGEGAAFRPEMHYYVVAVFLLLPSISGAIPGMAAFALGGLACSALLPLSISFATQDHPKLSEVVGGGMVAAYMAGFGIGSFGVGPIRDAGLLGLGGIYRASSVLALGIAIVAFVLLRLRPAGAVAPDGALSGGSE